MTESSRPEAEPLQTFEWTSPDGPSCALIMALSTVLEVEPRNMDPLYDVVEPDALDRLFAPTLHPYERTTGSIWFTYHDHWININANGSGYIYEQEAQYRLAAGTTSTAVKANDD